MKYWGIDLGGTKIEAIVLSGPVNNMKVLCRKRISTEADKGYEHVINRIVLLLKLVESDVGFQPHSLGIGTPGTLDPISGCLKNSNTVCLNGKPFKSDLEKELGITVSIANDANCFALAEVRLGAIPDQLPHAKTVFGVIMGTGVGGGIVINHKTIVGRQGIAGEWGHNFLDVSGGNCYCGRSGCVETILSGKALESYYENISETRLDLKKIYERYKKDNNANADEVINRLLIFFGKAMGNVINILDPDAIILGGGVGNIDALYTKGVEEVKKYVFNSRLETAFLKPKLGDSAGVFGAALLTY